MKRGHVAIICVLLALSAEPSPKCHKFTGANGKDLYAHLVSYDAKSKKVGLRTPKKGFLSIPIGLFSEADRQYVVEWAQEKALLDDKVFRIRIKKKRQEDKSRRVDNGFDITHYYDRWFEISVENKSGFDFLKVEVEYDVFYSQEELESYEGATKREKFGVRYASFKKDFLRGSKTKMETERILLFDYSNGCNGMGFPDMKGELEGAIFKLHLTLPSGRVVSRTLRLPKSLKRSWTSEDREPHLQDD